MKRAKHRGRSGKTRAAVFICRAGRGQGTWRGAGGKCAARTNAGRAGGAFFCLQTRAEEGILRGIDRMFQICLGRTLGGRCPPNTPWQEPEVPARCSIVALRPVGRIARFAPHLQVAVSATGRAPFRCLPVFTQIMQLRQLVRAAREHCAVLCAAAGRTGWETLGALPLRPRQEPEVPASPGFYSKPCGPASSSALCANIARFFVRPRAAQAGRR